jgi:nitrous oxide reductase accessory protein NosL
MRQTRLAIAAVAAAAMLAAGCGSSDSSSSASGPRSWTLADFLRLTGMKRNADGLTYTLPGHPSCPARLLLRSTAEVQTYKNAGDTVATNPDKSAGVRVEPEEPAACKGVFTQALSKVK